MDFVSGAVPCAIPIVDFHCHVPSADFVPRAFQEATTEAIASTLRLRGTPAPEHVIRRIIAAHLDDPRCERMLVQMDREGIGLVVLIVPDFTFRLNDGGPTIADLLVRVASIVEAHPGRFAAVAGVDPRWGKDGIDLFEKSLSELGFGGFKVYPPSGVSPSDRSFYPYYELCASYGVPVMVHTGGSACCLSVDLGRPLHVDAAACDFPRVPFVLAHGCANLIDETVTLCTFRPNVFVDTSAVPVGAEFLFTQALQRGIGHKLIYGSDWPVFHSQGGIGASVRRLLGPSGPLRDLPPGQIESIMAKRARDLLGNRHRVRPCSGGGVDAKAQPALQACDPVGK
jgi:predicted TIM-barrel fold metal-dependent hydrolase